MQHLDLQAIRQAPKWFVGGERVWFYTVLTTYGSTPRASGSLLAMNANGHWIGSLSGGCIKDDFFEWVAASGLLDSAVIVCYGEGNDPNPNVRLPCGGILNVLVENLVSDCDVQAHLRKLESALLGQRRLLREVELGSGVRSLRDGSSHDLRAERDDECVRLRAGATQRLLLAGHSSVAHTCTEFGKGLSFEVIPRDPREEALRGVLLKGTGIRRELSSPFIADGSCRADTAVVALTHDPEIDDLAMLEAVRTEAFYIGVTGSWATSEKRFERLRRIGGLGGVELAWTHVPIGFNLGSKTPAEIVLAVLTGILRIRNGIPREWF